MFGIVAKQFTPAEFAVYVAALTPNEFTRSVDRVVIHNTAPPTLANRPHGFSYQNMLDMRERYANVLEWSGGPHVFVDDTEKGIWVFNPLKLPGVHSPSWNSNSYAVEMLGDYEEDDFLSGRGAKVGANAIAACSILLKFAGLVPSATSIRFHKEDPKTNHTTCPGKGVVKSVFVAAVQKYGVAPAPAPAGFRIVGPDGTTLAEGVPPGDGGTGLVRKVIEGIGWSIKPVGKVIHIVRPEEE